MTMDLPNFHTPSAHPTTITTSALDIMDVKPLGPGGRQQPKGFLAFANGTPRWTPPPPPPSETTTTQQSVVVSYKECLRNHAANIGGHALDGCCEFMPSPSFTPSDPTSLKCAACGCHRNFHRRDPDDPNPIHHHHSSLSFPLLPRETSPPPPPPQPPQQDNNNNNNNNNNTSSAAAYFSSALLALSQSPGSGATTTADDENLMAGSGTGGGHRNYNSLSGRKRFRTKFSQEQKDKMYEFSEKVGWRLKKDDEGLIEDFCNEVGVGRTVLKVWMHNNKNTFGNRQNNNNYGGSDILNGNSVTSGFSLGNGVFHSGNGNSNGAVKKVGTACDGLGSNGHQLKQELHRNGQEFSEDGNCENFQGVSSNGSGSSSSG